MEPYFENVSVYTVEQRSQALYFLHRKEMVRSLIIIGLAMLVVCACFWEERPYAFVIAILGYGFLFVRQLGRPRRAVREIYEARLAYYDNKMPQATYRFYDDHFTVTDIDSSLTVPYRKIQKVASLKSCVAIQRTDGSVHVMGNTCFTKGTREQFLEFMKAKGAAIQNSR